MWNLKQALGGSVNGRPCFRLFSPGRGGIEKVKPVMAPRFGRRPGLWARLGLVGGVAGLVWPGLVGPGLIGSGLVSTPAWAAPPEKAIADTTLKDNRDDPGGELETAFYIRSDTDKTVVITPSVHFRKTLGPEDKTGVDVIYLADVWTSASIDVRSAASKEVVEQRDEVNLSVDHEEGLWRFGVGYRHSFETDYVSNALSIGVARDAFMRNTTFEGRVFGAMDTVGRSGDENFSEPVRSFGVFAGVTQVLSKQAMMQVSGEFRYSKGYLSSPYRYVPIGDKLPNCGVQSGLCLPEAHPGLKTRLAGVVRFRHALGKKLSAGAAYRFYWDLWKIQSHTAQVDLAANVTRNFQAAADFRFYTQSAAFFYRTSYNMDDLTGKRGDSYLTRDRELSPLSNIRAGLRLEYAGPVSQKGFGVKAGILGAFTRFDYRNFIGLDQVQAYELATNLGMVF